MGCRPVRGAMFGQKFSGDVRGQLGSLVDEKETQKILAMSIVFIM